MPVLCSLLLIEKRTSNSQLILNNWRVYTLVWFLSLTCRCSLWQMLLWGTGCTRQGFSFGRCEGLGGANLWVNSVLSLKLELFQERKLMKFLKVVVKKNGITDLPVMMNPAHIIQVVTQHLKKKSCRES